jgi:radical SAM superfamily enzyme YgiQ (UPF0313 family)
LTPTPKQTNLLLVPVKSKAFGPAPRKRIYLIAPKTPPHNFWAMRETVDAVGVRALMPNNTLATLVALTPPDVGVEYFYCDENIDDLRWDLPCDLVALTGFTLHSGRLAEISKRFRDRGIPVALGGAFATLDPDQARPLADYFFIGEAEYTWPEFLREWTAGHARPVYEQKTFVDINDSPPPDWSFVRGSDYLYFTVQASRGCPNNCDYCDAVRIVGRKYRTKPIDQVMTEIRNAHACGAETVFFSDDNFYVNKKYTRELLEKMADWNSGLESPLSFSCQASVMITDDDELLRRLTDARLSAVFLGVESLRKACLEEVHKGHLYRENLAERVRALYRHGIMAYVGLIVGFDHDDEHTFEEIERFADETGSPLVSISVLNAPKFTVLYDRLHAQGRIRDDFAGKWHDLTNVVTSSMPTEELIRRHRALFARLYEAERFEQRAAKWLRNVDYFSDRYRNKRMRASKLIKGLYTGKYYLTRAGGPGRRMFFHLLGEAFRTDKRLIRKAITIATQYPHYASFVQDKSWQAAEG